MSILGDAVHDARVLDLYAGSGALGLEALSRGAASAEFVELAARSLAALKRNVVTLGVEAQATVHRGDALRFALRLAPHSFDIVLADPPYNQTAAAELVRRFREVPFGRILAVEHPATADPACDDLRRYGDTAITFCYAP